LAALLHAQRGQRLDRAGRYDDAFDAYRRALELRREAGREVAAALTLAEMGRIEGRRGNPAEEERLHRQALEVLDRTVPDSLQVSRVLGGLSRARATQDDVEEAMVHAGRSLEIAARLAPGGFDHEAALMIHGIFHWLQEDWERAEARLLEALEIVEALDPRHEDVSNTLHNLGLVASYRGDQAQASDYMARALEAAPNGDPIQRTKILNSLGTLAVTRHDLPAARRWFHQVLEIRERLTPGSLNVATPLVNLGEVARLDGSLAEAERLFARVLELQRRFIPESRDPAMTLLNLAMVSHAKGDLETAEERALQALGIVRQRFPGVLLEASVRHTLGAVRHEAGRSGEGELELRRSIDLFERLAPGTTEHALAVYDLGRVQRDTGRTGEAVDSLLGAVGILERQVRRLGGSDVIRSRFRGRLLHVYRDGIELLMDLGRREEAFRLLERSQARSLLALLTESGIDFDRGLPPDLRARWTDLSMEHDRLTEELAGLSSEADSHRVADLLHRLDQQRLNREDLRRRIGGDGGGVLAEDERKTLDLEGALGALPDDMVALSYSVAAERSWSFILGPGHAFRVVELGVGAAELQDLVDRLLLLIE
ncbi:MAG: tetratricopeptide repeat protein, partial [Vicinamibacteria bacterium]